MCQDLILKPLESAAGILVRAVFVSLLIEQQEYLCQARPDHQSRRTPKGVSGLGLLRAVI